MSFRWSLALINIGVLAFIAVFFYPRGGETVPKEPLDLPRPMVKIADKSANRMRSKLAYAVLTDKLSLGQAAMILFVTEDPSGELPPLKDLKAAEQFLRDYARIVVEQAKLFNPKDKEAVATVRRLEAELEKAASQTLRPSVTAYYAQ